jgi:hypothetical protein
MSVSTAGQQPVRPIIGEDGLYFNRHDRPQVPQEFQHRASAALAAAMKVGSFGASDARRGY